jgi:hypothetical protein
MIGGAAGMAVTGVLLATMDWFQWIAGDGRALAKILYAPVLYPLPQPTHNYFML